MPKREPGTSERSPVEAVLAGDASYDALTDTEQAVVRAAWDTQVTQRLDRLDLTVEFEADGESWVEADTDGNTVTRST